MSTAAPATHGMVKIERPKSLTEIAVVSLREDIVAGRLPMGAALSESILSEQLGISRTPVREALMRLQAEGLVRILPQRGTFVFTVDRKELAEICDLRTALEMPALRFAIERQPGALAASLDRVVADMTDALAAHDTGRYMALDTRFHAAFFRHCDNRYLTEAYQVIAAKMAALRNKLIRDAEHMVRSFQGHLAIADAVRTRDAGAALGLLEAHIGRKPGSFWITDQAIGPLTGDGGAS